jgi:hypothetical protein
LGRDPFLDAVGALRELVRRIASEATWSSTFAYVLAFASRLVPLPTGDYLTGGILLLGAFSLGAMLGKSLDRKAQRRHLSADGTRVVTASSAAAIAGKPRTVPSTASSAPAVLVEHELGARCGASVLVERELARRAP